ncbi:hypothetical protein J467_4321, partial [Acinetobacter baumannii 916567]
KHGRLSMSLFRYGLDYYLYAKVATGWLVFLGYLFFILFSKDTVLKETA